MSWINRSHIIIVAAIILIFANEFTLSFFDPQLPFDQKAIKNLRILDIAIILLILTLIFPYMKIISYLSSVTKETLSYILPVFIAVVALDIIMKLLGYGYPTHYNQENLERVPHPHDTFRGQPNVRDHNEFGFRGTFKSSENNYNIAIFGGSTTYNGTPPIIEIMSEKLRKKGMNVGVYNFGSVSSNHSQHVHRLIEFSDRYSFDLVIFYGGGNETFQYANYDPRPGYPYIFF